MYAYVHRKLTFYCILFVVAFASQLCASSCANIQSCASLLYFLEQKIEQNTAIDPIQCSETDIEALWQKLVNQKEIADLYTQYQISSSNLDLQNVYRDLYNLWIEWIDGKSSDLIFNNCQKKSNLNPYMEFDRNEQFKPYLMPPSHPLKSAMDDIFGKTRVIYSDETMVAAGFRILFSQPRSFIRVIRHPLLPEVLIKTYVDTDLRIKQNVPGWKWFVRRCCGAQKIKDIIKTFEIKHFIVANKWLYVLPTHTAPHPSSLVDPKPVVLVVQDMHLVPDSENREIWKTKITKKHLRELYVIISFSGGSSYRPDNIHFSYFGKFAFIDTEYPERRPDYGSIREYLNEKMRIYWDNLVRKGGE